MNATLQIAIAATIATQVVLAFPIARWLRRHGGTIAVVLRIALGLTASGFALWLLFVGLSLDIERHSPLLWSWIGISCLLTGGGQRLSSWAECPPWSWPLVFFVPLELAAIASLGSDASFASPEIRSLLIAPAVLALLTYFGASVGYLVQGGAGLSLRAAYESWIGRRFLLAKSSTVLSTVTTLSVFGVALGVWLVIVALGILAGFEHDLQDKIIGVNAPLILQKKNAMSFAYEAKLDQELKSIPAVVATTPYLQGEVAVASRSNYTGGLLLGIDPQSSRSVLEVLERLVEGSFAPQSERPKTIEQGSKNAPLKPVVKDAAGHDPLALPAPAPIPDLLIGVEMQKALSVSVGDRVNVLSPMLDKMTPVGMAPKSQPFRVSGVFSSGMYEFDARFAYTTMPAARRFFELGPQDISGLQIKVRDPEYADRTGRAIDEVLGEDWQALDWKSRNQTLFSALKLERVVAFVVLVFVILVASFAIVNTLTMSIIEKKKEIAILKTMGARSVGIMKLFLVQGMTVGLFGTLIGALMALGTVIVLERFGFWIPDEVYYIDSLPVSLEGMDVVLVVLAALLIVWDFAVFPALRGSRFEPVEGLRDG